MPNYFLNVDKGDNLARIHVQGGCLDALEAEVYDSLGKLDQKKKPQNGFWKRFGSFELAMGFQRTTGRKHQDVCHAVGCHEHFLELGVIEHISIT
jgi:hypothetical protein